jgi:mRNA-degrading endonuclease RelE of RelBE toxin-antitoxin system
MKYKIMFREQARRELRQLPKELRRNIGYRIEVVSEDLRGDVKKLKDQPNRYRHRPEYRHKTLEARN